MKWKLVLALSCVLTGCDEHTTPRTAEQEAQYQAVLASERRQALARGRVEQRVVHWAERPSHDWLCRRENSRCSA